jgi:heat shock protein HtpX
MQSQDAQKYAQINVPDWRTSLKYNNRRTYGVITTFMLIYLVLGFIIDIVVVHNMHPHLSLSQCASRLWSGQIFPFASTILLSVSVLSLMITYIFYNRILLLGTEYRAINPSTAKTAAEKTLCDVIEEMKIASGIRYMPKIYIIDAPYMNAFASGYNEKSAIIAVTQGLLDKLNRAELQAVIAHELTHIRHQDIKLSLTVAVLSNLLLIVLDMLFYSVLYRRDSKQNNQLFVIILILRYTLPIITLILFLFLSRTREFMADAGAVELMRDNGPLAHALLKIEADSQTNQESYQKAYLSTAHEQVRQTAYFFDPAHISSLHSAHHFFDTHPSTDERLKALGFQRNA